MESEEPASQEESRSNDPANQCEERHPEPVEGSQGVADIGTNPYISSIVTDEVLRHRIRALIDDKPRPSKWFIITTNPMASVLVGFVLSAFFGGFLTYYYGKQQQEFAARRSFSDELNKLSIQKLGEMWERIDQNELMVDNLLDRINRAPGSNKNKDDLDQIEKLLEENLAVVSKNRFWLGEEDYHRLKKNYLDMTGAHVFDRLLGHPDTNLDEALKKRDQAKQDIVQMRTQFLKGEP